MASVRKRTRDGRVSWEVRYLGPDRRQRSRTYRAARSTPPRSPARWRSTLRARLDRPGAGAGAVRAGWASLVGDDDQPAGLDPGPRRVGCCGGTPCPASGMPAGRDQPARRPRLGGRAERRTAGAGHGAEGLSAPGKVMGAGGGCRDAGAVAVPAGAAAQDRAGGDAVPDPGRGRPLADAIRPATAPWSWSPPTAGCASGSWPGCAATASTCCAGPSRSPRS